MELIRGTERKNATVLRSPRQNFATRREAFASGCREDLKHRRIASIPALPPFPSPSVLTLSYYLQCYPGPLA